MQTILLIFILLTFALVVFLIFFTYQLYRETNERISTRISTLYDALTLLEKQKAAEKKQYQHPPRRRSESKGDSIKEKQ
jgi:Na+/melibiose symporter-like transporter